MNAGQGADQAPGRLVMRSRGNLRLLLNAPLWPQMVLTPMESAKVCLCGPVGVRCITWEAWFRIRVLSLVQCEACCTQG